MAGNLGLIGPADTEILHSNVINHAISFSSLNSLFTIVVLNSNTKKYGRNLRVFIFERIKIKRN